MMHVLGKLFSKSPFDGLAEHTKEVHECVMLIKPLVEAFIKGDHEKLMDIRKQIFKAEHEADIVKSNIRESLPRQMFLSVDKEDLFRFLGSQDDIADAAEDLGVLLTIRKTPLHDALKEPFRALTDKVIETVETLLDAANELSKLSKISFSGPEAQRVLKLAEDISFKEYESDKLQTALAEKMFQIEDELDPVSVIFYIMIFHTLGELADNAENTADRLRLMILRR